MTEMAKAYLGTKVNVAVVTIPASSTTLSVKRRQMRAPALAFTFSCNQRANSSIARVDVSLLTIEEGIYEVKTTA